MGTHFQLKDQEIESLQSLELNDDAVSSDGQDLKTKLLHHLVEFSRVFQKNSSERDVEELIKTNNTMVNELLGWTTAKPAVKPAVGEDSVVVKGPIVWDEALRQKLIDDKVDLSDEKAKEFAKKQVQITSNKISNLIADLVRNTTSFLKSEAKMTFVIEPTSAKATVTNVIYLRSLAFNVSLQKSPIDLTITCIGLPVDKSCKARVRVTIKNQAGQPDFNRTFSKVFDQTRQGHYVTLMDLISPMEYKDESLGHMKDGKITVEMTINADELVGRGGIDSYAGVYTADAHGAIYDPVYNY